MSLPSVQTYGPDAQHRQLLADAINAIMSGRANNTGTFTLAAGATTTTVIDPAFESSMVPQWIPTTATAATAMTKVRLTSRVNGSFVVTHDNTADVDRTFLYTRWG